MMQVQSPQADAALGSQAACADHLEAVRSGNPARIAAANTKFIVAEQRRREASDPRPGMNVWWETGLAGQPHQNVNETMRLFLQGRVLPPKLVAFDPDYRTLSDDEANEVLNKGTLGGRPVRL